MGSDDEDNLFASDDENVVTYDEEPEQEAPPEDDTDALFDDVDEEDEGRAQPTREEPVSDGDQERAASGADRSDEEEPARQRKVYAPPIDISAPLVALPPSNKTFLMKASNIVNFEPRPFDPETFQFEQDEYTDELGIKRVRLRDQNVLRWRWRREPDGSMQRETNARFVKWSDGSWQLLLGDEVLDVSQLDMSRDYSYLYVLHGGCLQGQAQLVSKLQCRPSTLDSTSHKRLREMVDKRHTKIDRVGRHVALIDPEKEKMAKEKMAWEGIKTRENMVRRQEKKEAQYHRPPPIRPSLTVQALEQDDDDDLMAYGQPSQPASHLRRHYDDEGEGARKLMAAQHSQHSQHKHRRTISDDDEDKDEEDGDYEEEEEGDARKKSKTSYQGGTQERDRGREREKPKDKSKPKAKRGVVMSSDDED